MYEEESCSSHPAMEVILCIPQTPGTEDINLLSSQCLKNDKVLLTEQDQLPAVYLERDSPRGPSSLPQEIPAR